NVHPGPAQQLGVTLPDTAANRAVLLKLGVPEDAIEIFGSNLRNTYDEVLALRDWAARNGARSLIVPTEFFTARRVRWMLHRAFDDNVQIQVAALDPPDFGRANWWQHNEGIIDFQNEILKYFYYRVKY